MKWDKRFLELAKLVASWSKDPSTKCGAVIVDNQKRIVSMGFNGFPAGASDSEELYNDRDVKYRRVIHAEKNAILFSRCNLTGFTIYVWPMPPCSQCAAAIIQSGIKRVVTIKPTETQLERWGVDFKHTEILFQECGVLLELKPSFGE